MFTVSASAVLLSLGCGIAYAASDYFRKAAAHGCPTMVVLFYFIGGQLPVLVGWLLLSGETRLTADYWLPGAADVAFGLAGNLLFIAAVKRSPLSLMVPLLALVPVLAAGAGAIMLREMLSPGQIAGTALIVAGLLGLYMPADQGLNLGAILRAFRREPGVPFMIGTIVSWSLTPTFDKLCVQASSVPLHAFIQIAAICACAGAWLIATGGLRSLAAPAGVRGALAGGAIAAGIAYIFQLAAYMATLVAVVEALKRVTGLLAALVVGRVKFAEPITAAKLVGVVVLAVGVPLILIG